LIVACHQPNYLPWLGYFHKMAECDVFVILDDVQFPSRTYTTRATVRDKRGVVRLTLPVHGAQRRQLIKDVRLYEPERTLKKHLKTIERCYSKAPYCSRYMPLIESILGVIPDRLLDLNMAFLELVRGTFGISTPLVLSSSLEVGAGVYKTERLIRICQEIGARVFLSGQGARAYLDEKLFEAAKVALKYQCFEHPLYPQCHPGFVPNLSALDLLFNCGDQSLAILMGDA